MNFRTLKMLAAVSSVALGLALAGAAHAQTTVTTTLVTNSSVTVVDGNDIDFGSYFIAYRNADNFDLVMTASTGAIAVANAVDSEAVVIAAGLGQGSMTAEVPVANMVVQMERTAPTAFADPALAISSVRYDTATEADQLFPVGPATVDVTILAANTPELIQFGTTITISGQPDDANSPHTSDFDVTFSF